ncbi:probable cytochrome P450 6g2 [Copidosoma floridanum]|uniref:probable cytochrome P450 6g2 n=1 Tax=Copidosoma floridanum TaxID=29053 RepID=UPI0006C9CB56|nr:probable cytochrome P450 6g2 [Copidosoma floridanum]
MELFLSLLILIVLTLVTYWFATRHYNYWSKQHVPFLSNPVPVFGHMLPIITLKKNMSIFSIDAYKKTNASAIGFYFLQTPGLIVRDPELVKSVLQTHFNSFHNNGFHLDEKVDPVFSKNPFFATDLIAWKTARTRTGSHLTGKKLRHLFVIINEVCSKMDNYIDRKIKETNGSLECELKETFVKYTGEIVANAALGVQGQSFRDEPDQLSFTNAVKLLFAPTLINGIKQALLFYVPRVGNFLKVSLLEQKADSYFRENIRAVLKERTMSNVAPNDYLQFCINSNGEREIDSIIADVLIFYGDVYETSSTTLATLFYFLSQNKNIQVKLRQHILDVLKKNNGVVTYELLKDMNYLDQVIFETLRYLPPFGTQFKECTKEITLMGSDGLKFHLKPGDLAFIPVSALHMDETYWPEPETFDPDRFSPENVASRHRFVYLAFGEGPRMCIGIRLGMMLVKIAAVNLLIKYSVENSEKTRRPLEYDPASLMMYIKGGLWGRFERLNPNENH